MLARACRFDSDLRHHLRWKIIQLPQDSKGIGPFIFRLMKNSIVSLQGLAGCFHEMAAIKYFSNNANIIYRADFETVFEDVKNNVATHAVVAYKNTKYGRIYEVEDLLNQFDFEIVTALKLRIEFCLMSVPGSTLQAITSVYSQAPALVQCSQYLDKALPSARRHKHYDTAGAALDVSLWGDAKRAAVASRRAADKYNLEIIADDIGNKDGANETSFYVLVGSG